MKKMKRTQKETLNRLRNQTRSQQVRLLIAYLVYFLFINFIDQQQQQKEAKLKQNMSGGYKKCKQLQ